MHYIISYRKREEYGQKMFLLYDSHKIDGLF